MKAAPGQVGVPATGTAGAVRAAAASRRLRRSTVFARARLIVMPILATVIVFAAQLVEDADLQPVQMMPPNPYLARWAVVAMVAYVFAMFAFIEWLIDRSLVTVRPAVKIGDEAFASYRDRMRRLPPAVDVALLVTSAVVVVLLFVVLREELLQDDPLKEQSHKLPGAPLAAGVICAGYTVIGWAFLRLILGSARLARFVAKLTREPLEIKVFDTTPLIPIGNIALAAALAPAGVLIILLYGLGMPESTIGWSIVIEASVVIVVALLLSLRHIHAKMSAAKEAAEETLSVRIAELYEPVANGLPAEANEVGRINNSINAVVLMRKAVGEMTTWPFRNTVAFGRAVLIAAAPLIYTTLSQLIGLWIGAGR